MTVGTRVRALEDLEFGVEKGTQGVIDDVERIEYTYLNHMPTYIYVAWDRPPHGLPKGYRAYDPLAVVAIGILRTSYPLEEALGLLEGVEQPTVASPS